MCLKPLSSVPPGIPPYAVPLTVGGLGMATYWHYRKCHTTEYARHHSTHASQHRLGYLPDRQPTDPITHPEDRVDIAPTATDGSYTSPSRDGPPPPPYHTTNPAPTTILHRMEVINLHEKAPSKFPRRLVMEIIHLMHHLHNQPSMEFSFDLLIQIYTFHVSSIT